MANLSLSHFDLTLQGKNLASKLTQELELQKTFWSRQENAQILQAAGTAFNKVNDDLFDRVFKVTNRFSYTPSYSDQPNVILSLQESGTSGAICLQFGKINELIEELAWTIFDRSHMPGYTVTSQFGASNRSRIPIHIHRNSSELDSGVELNLSIGLKLAKLGPRNPEMRFYPTVKGQEFVRTHERLNASSDFLRIEITDPVTVLLFESKGLPHTVHFSNDLLIWAVFNGVVSKKYPLNPGSEVGIFK